MLLKYAYIDLHRTNFFAFCEVIILNIFINQSTDFVKVTVKALSNIPSTKLKLETIVSNSTKLYVYGWQFFMGYGSMGFGGTKYVAI